MRVKNFISIQLLMVVNWLGILISQRLAMITLDSDLFFKKWEVKKKRKKQLKRLQLKLKVERKVNNNHPALQQVQLSLNRMDNKCKRQPKKKQRKKNLRSLK